MPHDDVAPGHEVGRDDRVGLGASADHTPVVSEVMRGVRADQPCPGRPLPGGGLGGHHDPTRPDGIMRLHPDPRSALQPPATFGRLEIDRPLELPVELFRQVKVPDVLWTQVDGVDVRSNRSVRTVDAGEIRLPDQPGGQLGRVESPPEYAACHTLDELLESPLEISDELHDQQSTTGAGGSIGGRVGCPIR